eukprot:6542138-Prymnesium_polylepis.1
MAVTAEERAAAIDDAKRALMPYREKLGAREQKAIYLSVGDAGPLRKLEAGARKALAVLQDAATVSHARLVAQRNKLEALWLDARTAYYYKSSEAKGILPHDDGIL